MTCSKKLQHLGNLSAKDFLALYWQKSPLLIRQAFPEYDWSINIEELVAYSNDAACSTRLIIREKDTYKVIHGPVKRDQLEKLPNKHWTVLVQGINFVNDEVLGLLDKFSFIPYSRLDDVMVSFSAPYGGVGPHFDSYDVFLLQGEGNRTWEVSSQKNLDINYRTELKTLKNFKAEGVCTLEKGDMLYLPPGFSHNGFSAKPAFTFSIGFTSPNIKQIKVEFLDYLDEICDLCDTYSDPWRAPTKTPALIPPDVFKYISEKLAQVKCTENQTAVFIGKFLTRGHVNPTIKSTIPKTHKHLQRDLKRFKHIINPLVRILYSKNSFFIDGKHFKLPQLVANQLKKIADNRSRPISPKLDGETIKELFFWVQQGWIIRK